MTYHARSFHYFLVPLLATQVLSTYIPAVEIARGTSLASVTSLDLYQPAWDGSMDVGAQLEARLDANQIALYGIAGGLFGQIVSCACTSPLLIPAGPAPCALAMVASGAAAVFAIILAYRGGSTTRRRDGNAFVDHFDWQYPAIEGGATPREQINHAMNVEFDDGLPVLIGSSKFCSSEYTLCHKLWYSESVHVREGQNRTIHRVHVTPHEFDYRQPRTQIGARQVYDDDDEAVTASDGEEFYGGYVWEDGSETTLSQLASYNSDDAIESILDAMNNEAMASNKYERTGLYCQDWATPSDSSPGTLGYFWYYNDPSDYPANDESAWMQTCAEESDDPSPNTSR